MPGWLTVAMQIAGPIISKAKEWLNSAQGNMLKGYVVGRKSQRDKDEAARIKEEAKEVSHVVERAEQRAQERLDKEFREPPARRDDHFSGVRRDRPTWGGKDR